MLTPDGHVPSPAPGAQPSHVVLYIEDNAANRLLVERLCDRRPDLTLLSASAGYPGIDLARIHLPEIILMDINLPDINGAAILKILRDDPATAHIAVIALSSDAYPRSIEKGLAAGFFRYITKPFTINEFMARLDETLEYTEACRVIQELRPRNTTSGMP